MAEWVVDLSPLHNHLLANGICCVLQTELLRHALAENMAELRIAITFSQSGHWADIVSPPGKSQKNRNTVCGSPNAMRKWAQLIFARGTAGRLFSR